jgi:hypothetical protein
VFTPVTMKTFSPVLGGDSLLGRPSQQGLGVFAASEKFRITHD